MDMINKFSFGIDIGTSYCSCGTLINGIAQIIPLDKEDHLIPSFVYYSPEEAKFTVGNEVKMSDLIPSQKIYNAKYLLGSSYRKILREQKRKHWPFKIREEYGNPVIELVYNQKVSHFTPNDLISDLFTIIKQKVDEFLQQDRDLTTNIVLTVPSYYNFQQRKQIKQSASMANLEVIQLINEPIAAVIAYIYQNTEETNNNEEIVMVYDFGGSNFEVTIISINYNKKEIRVMGNNSNNHLGGEDIDNNIVQFYLNQYSLITNKNTNEISDEQRLELLIACEKAKIELNNNNNNYKNTVYLDSKFVKDNNIDLQLTNEIFDALNSDIYNQTIDVISNLINEINIDTKMIKKIILVGGSSKIKTIQELLKSSFPYSELYDDIDPQEIITYGATILTDNKKQNYKIYEILSHNLYTDIGVDSMCLMIKRNLKLPTYFTQRFTNMNNNQTYFDINIYEGISNAMRNNKLIGNYRFEGLETPNEAETIPVDVTFDVDCYGCLKITVRNRINGKCEILPPISLIH